MGNMLAILLDILKSAPLGISMLKAFEGIEEEPTDPRAAQLRLIAVGLLTCSSAFLVAAGIIWRPMQPQGIADVLGWTGCGLFALFVFVGSRINPRRK